MTFSEFTTKVQLVWARLKLEGSFLPAFPQFRATLFLMLALGIAGLGYGHLWNKTTDARTLSLLLSSVAWAGALLIVLLRHPWQRLKTFISQVASLLLIILFGMTLAVGYQLFFAVPSITNSVKYAWVIAAVLLAYLLVRMFFASFGRFMGNTDSRYPGLMTAPLLFALLVINYLWWQWPSIVALIQ